MTMRYKVSLRHSKEGYSVWVPGLPGCWSQGVTQKEALENIADAIKDYLAVAEEMGREEKGLTRFVEVRVHA